MANLQHSTLPSSAVHEPKWITINGTASDGKVLTNDNSTAGISQYRRLIRGDIDELRDVIMVKETDASVAQVHYIPTMFAGSIIKWSAIVDSAIATASNTYELQIDGITVVGSPITVTITPGSGGTAGDIVTASPSSANTVVSDQSLTVVNTSLGNTDAGVDIRFAIVLERS